MTEEEIAECEKSIADAKLTCEANWGDFPKLREAYKGWASYRLPSIALRLNEELKTLRQGFGMDQTAIDFEAERLMRFARSDKNSCNKVRQEIADSLAVSIQVLKMIARNPK